MFNYILFLSIGIFTKNILAQSCTSNYEPFYKGNCVVSSSCQGALLNNLCTGTLKCCINDTSYTNQNFVTKTELDSILTTSNARTEYISKILMTPTASPTCFQKAAFLSQLIHESGKFMYDEELGAVSSFAKYDGRADLGNTEIGDGAKYRGRGFIQITGRANYQKAGAALGIDLLKNPEMAAFPSISAKIAVWYWTKGTNTDLNTLADGTFYSYSFMTYKINGGLNGFLDRVKILETASKQLKCGQLLKGKGETCQINGISGVCKPLCVSGLEGKTYCGCNGDSSSGLCKGPANIRCCVEKCTNDMDLTFVLDSSGSITSSDFQKSLEFTQKVVESIEVGETKTRVAIINFSGSVQVVTYLNSIYNKTQLLSVIKNIPQFASSTATGDALNKCKEIYSISKGMRNESLGISKVILVITDGQSNSGAPPIPVADSLRSMGMTIISVGVGSNLNLNELEGISSNGRLLLIQNYQGVLTSFEDINQVSCLEPAIIPKISAPISVQKNSFKYFTYKIDFKTIVKSINIQLKLLFGNVNLFTSFTNQNPNDYEVFSGGISKRQVNSNENTTISSLNLPDGNVTQLYIGAKGLMENNSFVIQIEESDQLATTKSPCSDKIADCQYYLNQGVKCDENTYLGNEKFSDQCCRSCQTISSTSATLISTTKVPCLNKNDSSCEYYLNLGVKCDSEAYFENLIFKDYCCKSCSTPPKICKDYDTVMCKQYVTYGIKCTSNSLIYDVPIQEYCCKTCESEKIACRDSTSNCVYFASYCQALGKYKPHPCPKTCNVC